MRKSLALIAVMTVLVAMIVPVAAFAAPPSGTWVGSIQVMNIGGATANVTVSFYNHDGSLATTWNKPDVAVGESWNIYTPNVTGLQDGFQGSVVVSSDQPVVAIGSENVTYSNGTKGVSQFSGMGASDIASSFLLPNVSKAYGGAGWSTRITVQDASGASNPYTIQFYNADGSELAAAKISDTLGPSGSATWDQSTAANLPANWLGSAVVTGTGNLAVVVDDMSNDGRLETYNGIPAPGTTDLFIPTLLRNYGTTKWTTSFQVFNPSASDTANVTIDYYTAGSSTIAKTITQALGPRQSLNRYQGTADSDLGGINWIGSVHVHSDKPVCAIATQSSGVRPAASAYNAASVGATTAYLPTVLRNFSPTGSNWVSSFQIMNVSSSVTATVHIEYFTPGNPTPVKSVDTSILPYNVLNRYQPADDSDLPVNWQGSVKVTSTNGAPIVVVGSQSGLNNQGDNTSQYNGFPGGA